jgi:60 kDa SS-A/Ro ribonucleoprotein
MKYPDLFQTHTVAQSEPVTGKPMQPNAAGGFTFVLDDWKRLDRFLVLGSDSPTYYASAKELTVQNAQCVLRCLTDDGVRAVNQIVAISETGRAPKNDAAIFALAIAAGFSGPNQEQTRRAALEALPKICRIPTHLFAFVQAVKGFRGRGRGLKTALADWYLSKNADELAYHAIKYQSREGWSNRDVLRLARPKADGLRNDIFHWIVKGWDSVGEAEHPQKELLPIWAFERAKRATTAKEIVRLIETYGLVRECVPTQFLNDADVWAALLEKMPLTAMIRNLAKMTAVGLLKPLSGVIGKVLKELDSVDRIRKARIHPITALAALKTYSQGHGKKGSLTWVPVPQIIDALDGCFYTAFANVEPTGKRWLLGLDVSGSMSWGQIAGIPGLTPREGTAALALVTAAVEDRYFVYGFSHQFIPLPITRGQRLNDAIRCVSNLPFESTDCALPMLYALHNRLEVDVFAVLTDNETWAGRIHPFQALEQYRQKTGIPAKLIVVGMTATNSTIGDMSDAGTLDVVGFDTAAPQIMANFAR